MISSMEDSPLGISLRSQKCDCLTPSKINTYTIKKPQTSGSERQRGSKMVVSAGGVGLRWPRVIGLERHPMISVLVREH